MPTPEKKKTNRQNRAEHLLGHGQAPLFAPLLSGYGLCPSDVHTYPLCEAWTRMTLLPPWEGLFGGTGRVPASRGSPILSGQWAGQGQARKCGPPYFCQSAGEAGEQPEMESADSRQEESKSGALATPGLSCLDPRICVPCFTGSSLARVPMVSRGPS